MEQLDLQALASFVAVAKFGGLNAASRGTGIPKATISRRLRALELQFNTPLIIRSGHQLHLTDDGQTLFERTAPLFIEFESAQAEVSARGGRIHGKLRVNIPSSMARSGIGTFATRFVEKYPDVDLEIDIDDAFVDPAVAGYDLVIRANPARDSELVGRCFLRTETILAASPNVAKPQAQDVVIPAVILAATDDQTRWSVIGDEGEFRVIPRQVLRCSSMMLVQEAVIAGAGAALLPAWLINADIKAGRLVAWGSVPNREIEVWVLHTPSHLTSPKVKVFVQELVKAYNDP